MKSISSDITLFTYDECIFLSQFQCTYFFKICPIEIYLTIMSVKDTCMNLYTIYFRHVFLNLSITILNSHVNMKIMKCEHIIIYYSLLLLNRLTNK